MHQKLVPDPFLILVNNPKQPLHARNSFKNFERRLSKSLKKVNFTSSSKTSPLLSKVIKSKWGLELVNSRISSCKTSLEKFHC